MLESVNNKVIIKGQLLCCFLLLSVLTLYGQNSTDHKYLRLVDSANVHIENSLTKAQAFLDSIPTPIEKAIQGRVADFYALQALIQSDAGDYANLYQSYILALKYAEKEKNYRVGGRACIELFSNIYFVKKDQSAFKYLEKAKEYYILDNYENGLLEVEQMYAYVKYLDHKYKECNDLLLPNLEKFKKAKGDAYYYMFANYMLTENYIRLNEFKKAYASLKEFKTLKNNPTIVKYNYFSFEAGIYLSFTEEYSKKKQTDSTFHYLEKATKLRAYMGSDLIREFISLNADYYKTTGNISMTKIYLDSLNVFEKEIFKNMVNASYELNKPLLKAELNLASEKDKKFWITAFSLSIFFMFMFLSIRYFVFIKRHNIKVHDFNDEISNYDYLKSNNEKLSGKVRGLEEYIANLKNEIKDISSINEHAGQKERIKELYKSLHVNSSTLLDKSENHIELVNELNVQFFKEIKLKYPQLNDSEIITCYYLFMEFKNKEIALFLNMSIRALESKRYRITKKIKLDTQKTTLVEHLQKTFGH